MTSLIKKNQLESCDQKRSIAQNLHLILTTKYGEYKFDKHFGCALWDLEFENLTINPSFKESLIIYIKECIEKYESRLTNIEIIIDFKIEELPSKEGKYDQKRLKRKFEIKVNGDLVMTNESYNFSHKLYLSPFSYN
jgi:phage baseplate assembly protein W